jgi:hypothetical protein
MTSMKLIYEGSQYQFCSRVQYTYRFIQSRYVIIIFRCRAGTGYEYKEAYSSRREYDGDYTQLMNMCPLTDSSYTIT